MALSISTASCKSRLSCQDTASALLQETSLSVLRGTDLVVAKLGLCQHVLLESGHLNPLP